MWGGFDNSTVLCSAIRLCDTDQTFFRKNVKLALDPIVHESYTTPKLESNDIALLKLAEDVDLNTYTPACLPTSGADYTGQNGRVYGGLLRSKYIRQYHSEYLLSLQHREKG